ncbi:DUF3667 domain-containing protein [Sphingobacterium corticis]|uniref:DUF3667 domain-containing protein n=1 Tax=Sphingobacterium corticis TaxID=1812823 RepID=A0ABW5NJU4_9SPHI
MKNKNCLNCGEELINKYCSHCGQKSDTHRITFKNFIFHDVLHGTFHIDKGILFTAKQALIRPGKAALDYISGKRKPYYNVFLLILLTIGLMLFLRHYYSEIMIEQGRAYVKGTRGLNEASQKMDYIFSQKNKIVIFLFVPFAALNSYVLFRRKQLNLSEHTIIAGMILLGILLFSTFGNAIFYLNLFIDFSSTVTDLVSTTIISLIFLYIIYGYFNAFGNNYSRLGFSYRILLFFLLLFAEVIILLLITIGIVTNWEFGAIKLTPFN